MPLKQPRDSVRLLYTSYDIARTLCISPPTARKLMQNGYIDNCFQLPESREWRAPAIYVMLYAQQHSLPIPKSLIESARLYLLKYPEENYVLTISNTIESLPSKQVGN